MNTGIYKIEHIETGKAYYGSSHHIKKRWTMHRSRLMNGRHHGIKLQNAWNKYGAGAFRFSIVIICRKEDLLFYEQSILDGYQAVKLGYNICPIAGRQSGVVQSKESNAKRSAAMLGKKHSIESRARMSMAKKGKPKSPKVRALLIEANKNRIYSLEYRAKLSAAHKGRFHSDESRRKISIAKMGHPVSAATREKMSISKKGVPKPPRSPEHCAKMSASQQVRQRRIREARVSLCG